MVTENKITVPIVRHELIVHDGLLAMLREALDFLGSNRTRGRRLLYIIDYTEVRPFWDSYKPERHLDLRRDGTETVWSYLLGLERLFLNLEDADDDRIKYLRRAYDEQLELIDGLLCDSRFNTILLPRSWSLLRDDISYFAHWEDNPLGNRNYEIHKTTQDLSLTIRHAAKKESNIENTYTSSAESFGYWSSMSEKKSSVLSLIQGFIKKSNFYSWSDFPWQRYGVSDALAKSLWQAVPDEDEEEFWRTLIRAGSEVYNKAYGSKGHWQRESEGASELAIVAKLDRILQDATDGRLRAAFVTRNRQFHNALICGRQNVDDSLPWVLHPRLLSAFMIDQGEVDRIRRPSNGVPGYAETSHIERYRESLGPSREIVEKLFARHRPNDLGPALERFLKVSLRRSWDAYRRSDLAKQIHARIRVRKERDDSWAQRRKSPIVQFLNEILEARLERLDIRRELALIGAIPRADIWLQGKPFKGLRLPIDLDDDPVSFLALFKTDTFAHAFIFRSKTFVTEMTHHENTQQINKCMYLNIEEIFNNVFKKYIEIWRNEPVDDRSELSRLKNIYRIDRFEILLLSSICLAARGQYDLARVYSAAARSIWSEENSFAGEILARQIEEIDYLDGIVSRIEWRNRYFYTPSEFSSEVVFQDGIKRLQAILDKNCSQHNKRIQLLAVGFARELYSFAHVHKRPSKRIPISVDACISTLESVYQLSVARKFHFTAVRAKQQLITFVRMADAKAVPLNKLLRKRLSEAVASAAYHDMIEALGELRALPNWNDCDLPVTTRIVEAIGKWAYRGESEPERRELEKARTSIARMKSSINEPIFRDYVEMRLNEIDNYLQSKK